MQTENQRLDRRVTALEAQLAAAGQARDKAVADGEQARQERDAARKNLADAEAHAALLGQKLDDANQQLKTQHDTIDNLTAERDRLQQALAEAQAKPAAAAPSNGNGARSALQSQLDAANARADAATRRVESLQSEVQQTQAKLVQASDALAAATKARDQLQQTRGSLEAQSIEQANALASRERQLTDLQANATALQGRLDQAKADLERLQGQLADGRAGLAAATQARDALQSQLSEARRQRDALQAQLDVERQRSATLSQRLEQTAGDLQAARSRAASLTARLGALLQSHQGLQQLTQAQRTELADVRRALEDAQSQVARLTGARGIYTVQPGDSLSAIAVFFYRNGGLWPDILQANAHLIDDPDLIFPGMVLIVPEVAGLD